MCSGTSRRTLLASSAALPGASVILTSLRWASERRKVRPLKKGRPWPIYGLEVLTVTLCGIFSACSFNVNVPGQRTGGWLLLGRLKMRCHRGDPRLAGAVK